MTLMTSSTIWHYLAQFFAQDVLAALMAADCTSRVVLNERVAESLDEHYREFDLRKRTVVNRVRILRIGPYFVCDALDRRQEHPFRDTVRLMRALLARFRHIEEYHLLWHERPTMSLHRDEHKCDMSDIFRRGSAFLAIPFSSSPYLHTIDVELSLDKAAHLFLPTVVLPRLENIRLCIRNDHSGDLTTAGYTMAHRLSRFLNNHNHTLRSLSFETSLCTDFSPLFLALGFFAHLSKLVLVIPTSKPHLGDPSALKGFLQLHHDTVEHLSLRGFCTNQVWARMDVGWLSACLSGVTFSALRMLSVGTSFLPLDAAMLCIRQWADTLTTLDITGHYLSYEEAESMLRVFAGRSLGSLSVGVTCLSPELIDKLAQSLPGLTKLHLRIQSVVPHLHDSLTDIGGGHKQNDQEWQAGFCAEMGMRKYDGWKLDEVGIWKFGKSKLQYQGWCVCAVRGSLGHE
ncbi:hypothetical protein GGX14DRAFT_411470 [Mycena pura]|uniref:F-box domain-containing protein n=1 Tax=Mycena pura TaxID=153505 RepID=A0AAD6YW68_9AGAR|nr:hypothetical protein GGX14DRAFT_411470 [Mycena pura]